MDRVTEGVETVAFKSLFSEWSAPTDFNFNKFNKDAVKKEDEPVDIQKLLSLKMKESAPVDDGSGEACLYIVSYDILMLRNIGHRLVQSVLFYS